MPTLSQASFNRPSQTHLSLLNPRLSLFFHAFQAVKGIISTLTHAQKHRNMRSAPLEAQHLARVQETYTKTCAQSYQALNRYVHNRPLSFGPLIEVVGYDAKPYSVNALRFLTPKQTDRFGRQFEKLYYQGLEPILVERQLEKAIKANMRAEFKDEIRFQSRNECFNKTKLKSIAQLKKDLPTLLG